MTTKSEQYKQLLVSVLKELEDNGRKDAEAMWLLGNMAAGLLDQARKKSWRGLKDGLSREAYDGLLRDFETHGNALHQQGKAKHAYAIQILGVSIIGKTQLDPQLQAGEELLDEIIDHAATFYRKNAHLGTRTN